MVALSPSLLHITPGPLLAPPEAVGPLLAPPEAVGPLVAPPEAVGPPVAPPEAVGTPVEAERGGSGLDLARLLIRDLGPPDGHLVDELHAALSPRSRYRRYHVAKPRLSSRERAFLTGTDGHDHVALVALGTGGAPVGIARYVRLRGEPRAADVAAEVVDHHQRQGLGTALLQGLARRAAAAGIERFTATVLSDTRLPRSLARRGWRVRSFDGPSTTLEADVWTLLQASRA